MDEGTLPVESDRQQGTQKLIAQYLEYFLGLEGGAGFAFMINGKWGSGKTHFIKMRLSALLDGDDERDSEENPSHHSPKPIYVSLNGIESVDQIDLAIAQERIPGASNRQLGAFSRAGIGALTALVPGAAAINGLKLTDLLPDLKSRVVVFDDFERCGVHSEALLGYINFLVEHNGCWVVILVNESKLNGENDTSGGKYAEIKEKVVGHTMTLEPEFDGPFQSFCERRLTSDAKEIVKSRAGLVKSVFDKSGTNNLRILDQTLMILDQLLPPMQQWIDREEFMSHFLTLALSLAFEVKAGRLARDDLDFDRLLVAGILDEEVKPALKKTAERFGLEFLADSVLSSGLWQQLLFDGVVDAEIIKAEVARSILLKDVEDQPNWRIAWHYLTLDNDIVLRAIDGMMQDFYSREWRTSVEFLHVVGIVIRLHNEGVLDKSIVEIESDSRSYVDSVFSEDEGFDLALIEHGSDPINFNNTGLGMMEVDSPAFQNIRGYLAQKQELALEAGLLEKANIVLELIAEDPEQLQTILMDGGDEYEVREFLHYLDTGKTVEACCKCRGGLYRALVTVLYRRSELAHTLRNAKEESWFSDLSEALKSEVTNLAALDAARVRWLAERIKPSAT